MVRGPPFAAIATGDGSFATSAGVNIGVGLRERRLLNAAYHLACALDLGWDPDSGPQSEHDKVSPNGWVTFYHVHFVALNQGLIRGRVIGSRFESWAMFRAVRWWFCGGLLTCAVSALGRDVGLFCCTVSFADVCERSRRGDETCVAVTVALFVKGFGLLRAGSWIGSVE